MAFNALNEEPDRLEPCVYCADKLACGQLKLACYRFAQYCGSADNIVTCYRSDPATPNAAIYKLIFPGD